MHIANFLQDLAVIMLVAGLVTILFHLVKQPVVLGYILSGLILGQHTPPFSFIHDENTIKTLAELGVIFLMFSLGLEFSIRKLFHVGMAAFIAAFAEIIFMLFIGYEIGKFFEWKSMDSLFLGAMLAISSTTIIIKALNELGMKRENFAQLIFGILIIEDILAIGILAFLSSFTLNGSISITEISVILGKLLVFLVSSLVIGIFCIPKLISFIARFKSKEMLLIVVLGLCFGFSFLVIKLGYSLALGAFLIGAIIAESHEIKLIEKLIEPITNMFSAIFFVSIGLLVDPKIIYTYLTPIIVIALVLVFGKVFVCSLSVFLAGRSAKTSMRVGMGLAQIGEFSFIIASLGISLNVMSPYLYPIIVAVSAITTFLTPYLIKFADPLTNFLAKIIPKSISQKFTSYTLWRKSIQSDNKENVIKQIIKKGLFQIIINLILVIGIFIFGTYIAHNIKIKLFDIYENALIWGISLILSLPFLIAIYRKLLGLSLLMAEMRVKAHRTHHHHFRLNRFFELIPALGILCISVIIISLSVRMLPSWGLMFFILIIVFSLTLFLWPWFIKLHSRLQITLIETFKKKDK